MLYEDVFQALGKEKVRYLVVGGIAMVLHGHIRFTFDLDLIVDLSRSNILKFVGVMQKLGYTPRVPVRPEDFANPIIRERWRREKNMKVFTFIDPKQMERGFVDIFVQEPIPFGVLYRDKQIIIAEKTQIPLVSLEHLLLLKKQAGRDKDKPDITVLKEILQRTKRDEKN